MASPPTSQLPARPRGSPAVAITPTDDSASTFCFTRTTPIVASGATPATSFVLTICAPRFVPATRPFTLPPARIGTSRPDTSPMRRL